MKRNEICYVAIVAIIGASLLLGFAEEVFHTDLGGLKWAAHWVSSPVALAIGFAFALLLGKAFPAFNKTMSKKLLQYSVIGLGFGMNVDKALASGSEGMIFTIASVFGTLDWAGSLAANCSTWIRRPAICSVRARPSVVVRPLLLSVQSSRPRRRA